MGLFYERKLKQHSDKPRNQRIDALSAGQSHLAYGLELPEVAKKDIGRIFSDLYDQVYTDELLADELLCSLKLLNLIESEKKSLQTAIRAKTAFDVKKLFLIDGAYHTLFAIGQICEARGIDRLNFKETKNLVEEAIKYVSEVVNQEQDKDESFSFNRFFKDSKTKTKVAIYIQTQELSSV